MHRYILYFAIALSAFGIGFYFVYISPLRKAEVAGEPILVINKGDSKLLSSEINRYVEMSEIEFNCEDDAIKTIWNKLEEDKSFKEDADNVIKARQIKNCNELFDKQEVDLNNDKSGEIILKGNYILFFNSGGDFPTWIVSKFDNEYKIIFEGKTGELPEHIQFLQAKTNKFQDLKIKIKNGWEADDFGLFKFDGKQYQIRKCLQDVNSAYDYDEIKPQKLISVKLGECL